MVMWVQRGIGSTNLSLCNVRSEAEAYATSSTSEFAVQLHDLQGHLCRGVHVFYVEPLFHRVNGAHAGAEIGALNALAVENVGIATAAGGHRLHIQAHAPGGLDDELDDVRTVRNVHRRIVAFDV